MDYIKQMEESPPNTNPSKLSALTILLPSSASSPASSPRAQVSPPRAQVSPPRATASPTLHTYQPTQSHFYSIFAYNPVWLIIKLWTKFYKYIFNW